MRKPYDVIVVGAGPAGSTAAKLLADKGFDVLLLDRAHFPRHKTCASWINRFTFERFSYLSRFQDELVETPFWGVEFWDQRLRAPARVTESKPSGFLSLRDKFDDGLRRIAVQAGAHFSGGVALDKLSQGPEGVSVQLSDGRQEQGLVLIGADGASSRVAFSAGFRKGWSQADYVLCANEDLLYSERTVQNLYGAESPFFVFLQYSGIQGYGWVFPKLRHICVGVGGRLRHHQSIRELYRRFFEDVRVRGYLPPDAVSTKVYCDLDPVGAVHRIPSLVRNRVILIGDAGGFVSGSTGEGIYPGMVSAEVVVSCIENGFHSGQLEPALEKFNAAWRKELGGYVKRLPGGDQASQTRRSARLGFLSTPLLHGWQLELFFMGNRFR